MKLSFLIFFVTVLAAAGCTGSGASSAGNARVDQNLITAEEINHYDLPNLLDLVRARRPFWLQKRSPYGLSRNARSEGEVWVYMDEARIGGPSVLRTMALTSVTRLEYLPPAAANRRYGRGHVHGVILLHQDF